MMTLSKRAEEEIRSLAQSGSMKQDLETVACSRQNPFVKAGRVDVDAYITFVTEFNKFINHQPKRFVPIIDTDMRL